MAKTKIIRHFPGAAKGTMSTLSTDGTVQAQYKITSGQITEGHLSFSIVQEITWFKNRQGNNQTDEFVGLNMKSK